MYRFNLPLRTYSADTDQTGFNTKRKFFFLTFHRIYLGHILFFNSSKILTLYLSNFTFFLLKKKSNPIQTKSQKTKRSRKQIKTWFPLCVWLMVSKHIAIKQLLMTYWWTHKSEPPSTLITEGSSCRMWMNIVPQTDNCRVKDLGAFSPKCGDFFYLIPPLKAQISMQERE